MPSLSADILNMISAPCRASDELGGIVDQRSSQISIPKVVSDVSKSKLAPIGAICPHKRTVSVVN